MNIEVAIDIHALEEDASTKLKDNAVLLKLNMHLNMAPRHSRLSDFRSHQQQHQQQ